MTMPLISNFTLERVYFPWNRTFEIGLVLAGEED